MYRDRPGLGRGRLRAVVPDLQHLVLLASLDEVFLERQPAVGRTNRGPDGLIAHRQDADAQVEAATQIVRDLGRRQALTE